MCTYQGSWGAWFTHGGRSDFDRAVESRHRILVASTGVFTIFVFGSTLYPVIFVDGIVLFSFLLGVWCWFWYNLQYLPCIWCIILPSSRHILLGIFLPCSVRKRCCFPHSTQRWCSLGRRYTYLVSSWKISNRKQDIYVTRVLYD